MASKAAATTSNFDELDNFFLDGDLDDDPFASPKGGDKNDTNNKRKEHGDGLGIDEEVSIAKKARVPRIKLDQDRLMSQKGIPALRRRAKDLKLKGKGHEWSDATRLLSFYQDWLDDLFPKAKFLDALAMVEKAGHNKMMHRQRVEWIDEGRPKTSVVEDGEDFETSDQAAQRTKEGAPAQASRIALIFDEATDTTHHKTPDVDNLFGDEDDIYNATPIGPQKNRPATEIAGEPDEDELDALIAEAEVTIRGTVDSARSSGGAVGSIFGNGGPGPIEPAKAGDEDDLDALMAEADAAKAHSQVKPPLEADKATNSSHIGMAGGGGGGEDDLDALIAEAEAQSGPRSRPPATVKGIDTSTKPSAQNFDDEEEAMAEMDGLW